MPLEELPEDVQRELCEGFTTVSLRGRELVVLVGIIDMQMKRMGLYARHGPEREYWEKAPPLELEREGIRGALRLAKAAIAHKRAVVQMDEDVLPDPFRRILWLAEEFGITDD